MCLPDPALLVQRLLSSAKLKDLFTLVDFDATAESALWKCGAVNTNDTVTVFLLPWKLYWHKDDTRTTLLPVILLQYTLDLNSDLNVVSPLGDTFLHFDLVTPPTLSDVPASMKPLLTQLSSQHTHCYLQLVQRALTNHWVFAREDFLTGLSICQSSQLSVDLTPLLAALCHHAVTCFPTDQGGQATGGDVELGDQGCPAESANSGGHADSGDYWTCHAPLQSDVVCRLLTSALSKLMWTCFLRVEEGRDEDSTHSICNLCTQQVSQAFLRYLEEVGFKEVPQCGPSYFWMDNGSLVQVRLCGA